MNKISIQSLNSVLNLAEDLSSTVSWIRDISLKKQIYVSSQYEPLWGRSTTELYNNPPSFNQTLLPEDDSPRRKNTSGLNLYRIQKPDGKIAYIKDRHYVLMDINHHTIGHIGFANEITERLWFKLAEKFNATTQSDEEQKKNIIEIIKKEFKLYSIESDSTAQKNSIENLLDNYLKKNAIKLTAREKICLGYLLQGNLPKKIADKMCVSIRTIEYHLDNIKRKFRCRHSLELLSLIYGYRE